MTWHYQLMRHKEDDEEYLAIHEYYHFESVSGSKSHGWTEDYFVTAETPEEMKEILQRMIEDIDKHGVKDFD